MPTQFTLSLSGNYKPTFAKHRSWRAVVGCNGESWPIVFPGNIQSSSDIYRLGIIPTYVLTAPTTTSSGTSTPGTYGVVLVYRSTKFNNGLTGDNIQGNRSNIVDSTLTSSDATVLTLVTTTDTKIDKIDIYAAQKIGAVYGTFYRVVKDVPNSAGTVTFNPQLSGGLPIGSATSAGTVDASFKILATDNDFPYAQPILLEVNGRLIMAGGNPKRVTATFANGSATVSTQETIFNGINFWYLRRDSETTGGVDGRGTYLCNFATVNTVSLVAADGTSTTYAGTSGLETATIWTDPIRRYSQNENPHSFPADNVNTTYRSAILAGGIVPNTNRVLLMGVDWVIAEDYDRLPIDVGLNYISTERGCSSHFSIVAAHGKLYWLDLGHTNRRIVMSDGTTVVDISTEKIKSILNRVTLDSNGDVWRVGFIPGIYIDQEDVIRWGLYLDNNTVSTFELELDLATGDVRGDPVFYTHRALDVFTYGKVRGRPAIGQFGWDTGIARIGLDNVDQRYRDWVAQGTLSGSLDIAGQTSSVLTVTGASFDTTGDGLKGIQVLLWQENTDGTQATLIAAPTYYHCRISANTATTFTVNYVETMNSVGEVSTVATALPSAPSGLGWQFAIGVIQAVIGPKWYAAPDAETRETALEIGIIHHGQALGSSSSPIRVHSLENLDNTPRDAQYAEASIEAVQVADSTLYASSFALPKTNPSDVLGFIIVDNNVNTNMTALNIETITVETKEAEQNDS